MKKMLFGALITLALGFASVPAFAKKNSGMSSPKGGSHAVRGHVRKDGTYVQPHRVTNQNRTQRDNWSSKPNVNPYNGKPGSKEPQY